jgi:Zn-dependent protease/CBS domain-containing protein
MKSEARLGDSAATMHGTLGDGTDNEGDRADTEPIDTEPVDIEFLFMAASTEDPTTTAPGLRLATIGGVPVYIGKSWPVIALVIVFSFGPSIANNRPELGPSAYFVALIFAVLLLISVLAHEAAHAVVATRVGYRVNRVVADLWGGHTAYDSSSARPGPSALVAIAGPAANGLLALVGWLAMPAVPPGGITSLLVGAIVYTNAFVAGFNLLPGLPLDGGFLVDSLVWRITGSRETGMIAAGWCGRVVTILVMLWFLGLPLLKGQPPDLFSVVWGLLIGSFLWVGATNAIRAGRGSRLLNGIRIDSVWRPAASLPPQASAAQAFALRSSGPEGAGGTVVVVEDDARNAIGLLDDEALLAIPEQSRRGVAITSVMRRQPDGWVVKAGPHESIATVVGAMQSLGIGAVPVRAPDGRIVGIVLAGDLQAALSRRPAPPT